MSFAGRRWAMTKEEWDLAESRLLGYYWVKYDNSDKWVIREYGGQGSWFQVGGGGMCSDLDLAEIDERRIVREP